MEVPEIKEVHPGVIAGVSKSEIRPSNAVSAANRKVLIEQTFVTTPCIHFANVSTPGTEVKQLFVILDASLHVSISLILVFKVQSAVLTANANSAAVPILEAPTSLSYPSSLKQA